MKTKECPSCAMEVDATSKVCPICSYEFAETSAPVRWVALLMALILLLYLLF